MGAHQFLCVCLGILLDVRYRYDPTARCGWWAVPTLRDVFKYTHLCWGAERFVFGADGEELDRVAEARVAMSWKQA